MLKFWLEHRFRLVHREKVVSIINIFLKFFFFKRREKHFFGPYILIIFSISSISFHFNSNIFKTAMILVIVIISLTKNAYVVK